MKDVTPCKPNPKVTSEIETFAEELKTQAHTVGSHGMSEKDFYESGIFEGAIERIRGQKSATMAPKKRFVQLVLNHMQDQGFIKEWEEAGAANRHDLSLVLQSGKIAVIELKGCLDGNNTNISDRPPHAEEFVTWSLCQNKSSNLRKGVWSGIHTRMSADIVDLGKRLDGLIVWDWICNTMARPCPKIAADPSRVVELGEHALPPPCLYAFPGTVPSPRNNPKPSPRGVDDIEILKAFKDCFGGTDSEMNTVAFEASMDGPNLMRKTTIVRDGAVRRESGFTAIKRR
ncbi:MULTISPECIES: hypothetical protein [Hyphomonas]|uniref:hypothetical protein n=1 Tax=Hyphomonas TaxID=85 RepID=UPI003518794D